MDLVASFSLIGDKQEDRRFTMIHYCAHCEYKSPHKWVIRRHVNTKHKIKNHLEMRNDDQHMDQEKLMEESIEVWKMYKLLQRMKKE